MGLSQTIVDAVSKARREAGDLVVTYKVRRKAERSYFNGRIVADEVDVSVSGLEDKFEAHELDGSIVQLTDSKVMLFIDSTDQIPTTEDRIVKGDEVFQVKSCEKVFAGATVVVAMVHLRK